MAGSRAQRKHQSTTFSPPHGSSFLSILPYSQGNFLHLEGEMSTGRPKPTSSKFLIQKEEGLTSSSIWVSILRHNSNWLS